MSYLNQLLNLLKRVGRKINNVRNASSKDLPASEYKFLENAYRETLGRNIDRDGLKHYTKLLKQGYSQSDVLISLVKSEEFINKILTENHIIKNLSSTDLIDSDQIFLENAYRKILGRKIDEDGLYHYTKLLKDGYSKTNVLMNLIESKEFIDKVLRENHIIQSLRELRPSSYQIVDDVLQNNKALVFTAETKDDFDWLESMILEYGYYEKPGVWSFDINTDKRVMAEIMSSFKPSQALEIGCANGALLHCLYEMNIFCEGVEISNMAIKKAFPQIKNNIHKGDILDLELSSKYDLIFGLDVFEHLNPNKLDDYINKIYGMLSNGGYVFCNIPAFGSDPIFGTVFPIYIKDWELDVSQERIFSKLHVDKDGYPINGHLIWADSHWWVKQFEQKNFHREVEIEKAFHKKYDDYMNKTSVARRSYYVFSKDAEKEQNEAIINLIKLNPSQVLNKSRY